MAAAVGDDLVILEPRTGRYFGLDPVGSKIWKLLLERRRLHEVVEALYTEFDASRETIDADVSAFIRELLNRGLVESVETAGSAAARCT